MTATPGTDAPAAAPKLIVADADPLARRAIKELLAADGTFVVVAEARDGIEATELASHYHADLLLTEALLPSLDALEVTRRVLARRPDLRVVLFTACDDTDLARDALRAGVSGILSKDLPADALRAALLAVNRGEAALPPALAAELVERFRKTPGPGQGFRPIRSSLTNREWEILDLLMAEATTAQIAAALFLTEDTVYSHVKHILRKLGVRSRAEAVEAARRLWETHAAVAAA